MATNVTIESKVFNQYNVHVRTVYMWIFIVQHSVVPLTTNRGPLCLLVLLLVACRSTPAQQERVLAIFLASLPLQLLCYA